MTTFTKIAKAANSLTNSAKAATAYLIAGARSFLLKQDGFYLLLQTGDRIIVRVAPDAKEAVSYTKVAKP